MSIEPEALDRSVLESKGRDELQAIAAAIGAKPGSRARKAQIVDSILAAAGIESTGSDASSPAPEASAPGPEASAPSEPASQPARQRTPSTGSAGFSADPWADAADEADAASARRSRMNGGDAKAAERDGDGQVAPEQAGAASADATTDGSTASAVATTDGEQASTTTDARTDAAPSKDAEPSKDGETATDAEPSKDGETAKDAEPSKDGEAKDGEAKGGDGGKGRDGDQGRNRNRNRDRNRDGGQGRTRDDRPRDQPEPGNRRRRRRGRDRDRDRDDEPQGEPVDVEGILDLRDEGYGFLRTRGMLPSSEDVYVGAKQVRQFGMRRKP